MLRALRFDVDKIAPSKALDAAVHLPDLDPGTELRSLYWPASMRIASAWLCHLGVGICWLPGSTVSGSQPSQAHPGPTSPTVHDIW